MCSISMKLMADYIQDSLMNKCSGTSAVQKCTYKGPGKRGHIVADTLLPMMFLGLRKLGNICCGHKMFLNKIRNIFVSRTQNLCPQQMLHTRANGVTFVSATMCPQQCVLVCQGLNTLQYTSSTLSTRIFPNI